MTTQELRHLPFFEYTKVDEHRGVTRVPGGYIYTLANSSDPPLFVPISEVIEDGTRNRR